MSIITISAITENEIHIIETLRSLKPFEQIVIVADKLGRPDNYVLTRSFKVSLGDRLEHVRLGNNDNSAQKK